jgi:hypothetical protein
VTEGASTEGRALDSLPAPPQPPAMRRRPLAAACALLTAVAAGAALADPPASPASKERLVCRGGERQLGSHMRSTRRCRTAEEWRRQEVDAGRMPPSLQVTQGQNDGVQPRTPQ